MPNGKPHDHPITDTVLHGLHPFPPDIEELVRQIHAKDPAVFNHLQWASFEWEKGNHLAEARVLLKGLLEHHGNPEMCRQLVRVYEAATERGFRGQLRSVKCAVRGIAIILKTQHNARLHAVATVAVIAVGGAVRLSVSEWCWIVLAITSVWTAEALNTAFEFLTDVASPDFHPIAEKAKDVAAGAVLLAACGAAVIGVMVLGRRVLGLLQ